MYVPLTSERCMVEVQWLSPPASYLGEAGSIFCPEISYSEGCLEFISAFTLCQYHNDPLSIIYNHKVHNPSKKLKNKVCACGGNHLDSIELMAVNSGRRNFGVARWRTKTEMNCSLHVRFQNQFI